MIRVFVLVIVAAWLLTSVTGLPQGWALGISAVAVVAALIYSGTNLHCPQCGKGIKLGFGRCHHCGWARHPGVAEPAMLGPRSDECSCDVADVGTGETGPSLSVSLDEACPLHGKGTAWAAKQPLDPYVEPSRR